jgi:putative tryptophan/tyrosine transport system substrate-binding protein
MHRRKFIALVGGAAVLPTSFGVSAQQRRLFHIGTLNPTFVEYAWVQSALPWLAEFDLVEGRDFRSEARFAAGRDEELPELAAGLVRLNVDLIVTQGRRAIRAAKQATGDIPIVMIADGDPVADGLVQSLARPGGNLTGIALPTADLLKRRLELLKELLPALTRVGLLVNPDDAEREDDLKTIAKAADQLRLKSQILPVRSVQDFEPALSLARSTGCGGIMVLPDRTIASYTGQVQDVAIAARMPMIFPYRSYVRGVNSQGLMSYGAIPIEIGRHTSSYIHRIMRGAMPADLPIEPPAKFELFINLRVANAIGITVPESLLSRADMVIEVVR